jgi:hypothetical protein
VESGKWKVESGEWKVESREWKVECILTFGQTKQSLSVAEGETVKRRNSERTISTPGLSHKVAKYW